MSSWPSRRSRFPSVNGCTVLDKDCPGLFLYLKDNLFYKILFLAPGLFLVLDMVMCYFNELSCHIQYTFSSCVDMIC